MLPMGLSTSERQKLHRLHGLKLTPVMTPVLYQGKGEVQSKANYIVLFLKQDTSLLTDPKCHPFPSLVFNTVHTDYAQHITKKM